MTPGGARDVRLGIGIALFGALLLVVAIPYGIVVPKGVRSAVLSPDFWPRAIAIFILAMGALLALQSRRAPALGEALDNDPAEDGLDARAVARLALAVLLLGAYYLLVQPLGMVIASSAAILAFGLMGGGARRPLVLVAVALILPLLLYGFFVKIAGLPIPTGRWLHFP